jgi:hypothetical protein
MHVNISRDTFDPLGATLRVVQEQGAVPLDADANEQTAVLLRRLHQLAEDVFGPNWGPAPQPGFGIEVVKEKKTFTIGKGRYYVGGLLCENREVVAFAGQPHLPLGAPALEENKKYLVYLDVWERVVHEAEWLARKWPVLADPGLGQIPAAPRTELVWQVRALVNQDLTPANATTFLPARRDPVAGQGALAARSAYKAAHDDATGKTEHPYREPENFLYRIEIHRTGEALPPGSPPHTVKNPATFKWSRTNGATTFPISPEWINKQEGKLKLDGKYQLTVELAHTPTADRPQPARGQVVEYVDAVTALDPASVTDPHDPRRYLFHVVDVSVGDRTRVTLKAPDPPRKVNDKGEATPDPAWEYTELPLPGPETLRWAYLRLWDQPADQPAKPGKPLPRQSWPHTADDGALLVVAPAEGDKADRGWLTIDGAVQVRFAPVKGDAKGQAADPKAPKAAASYQAGDYWLVPARSVGDIIWKLGADKQPQAVPATPAADHRYAPLAVVDSLEMKKDLRRMAAGTVDPPKPQNTPPVAPAPNPVN